MMKSIILLLVSALFFSASFAALTYPVLLDPTSGFSLQWEIVNNTITFQASVNAQAWLGIGFHCNGCQNDSPMENTDFVVAVFDSPDTLNVYDMWSNPNMGPGHMMPFNDTDEGGEYNIISYSGYQTADYSTFIFSRLLNTGDTKTDQIIVPGAIDLDWAFGQGEAFDFHGEGNAGRLTVNLLSGTTSPSKDPGYINYHAGFMTVAFAILMPMGVFVGRYLKGYQWWFPLHIILQVTAAIFAIVGFALAIKMLGGLSFDTLHAIFGLITLILMILAILMGALSHKMWDPSRSKTPIFPDMVHWFGGRLVIILGIVTIFLGMVLHQVPTGIIVVFALTLGFYGVLAVFLEVYIRIYPNSLGEEHKALLN